MSKKQKLFAGFLVLFLIVFMGTSCIQDAVIPCHIDTGAIEYSDEEPTIYTPYTTIFDAERIKRKMDYIHLMNQEELKRLGTDDNMIYSFLNDAVTIGMADAYEIKGAVFDPTGPLALMLPALMGLGIGRYIKSPNEKKVENELVAIKTTKEV